ncbi:uncharacterized protein EDB91DRAFT_1164070 [Suillus paluster]|uniref:uncharacterized protein n=1 Tax=Suillus paluster TaxID=48578 RepID=UPI001B877936|nr:uncharacterized protein EDB91DRAFT_1164070 [Suillus paluster]KAG1727361.1 hypothetical protein EDB91DRAFT_1164070 [Suillus paluster]
MGVTGLIATICEYLAALLSPAVAKSIYLALLYYTVTEMPRCIVGDQIRLLFVTGVSLSLCISRLRRCVLCVNIFPFLV